MKRLLMITATLAALLAPLTGVASAKPNKADKHAAKQECRAERQADKAAFREKYGTNHNKHNAFGKCVSQKSRAGEDGGS